MKRPSWKYNFGVVLAFIIGGYFGHFLFLLWVRWHYGVDPLRGFIEIISRADGSRDQIAFVLPFIVRWVLISFLGIAVYELYRRTIGRTLKSNGQKDRPKIWFILFAGFAVLAFFGIFGPRAYNRLFLYSQAEPLVATVWPIAQDIQSFIEQNGRRPQDLEDLRLGCHQSVNYAPLMRYEHVFHANGDIVLTISVNRRYGFVVDENYCPWWTHDGERF